MKNHYELKEITEALGIKRTKLQQWMSFGYVRPSIEQASGQGTRNKWSFADVVALSAFRELIKMGLSRAAASKLVNLTKVYVVDEGRNISAEDVKYKDIFQYNGPDPLEDLYTSYLVQYRHCEDSSECGIWTESDSGLKAADRVAEHLGINWSTVIILNVGDIIDRVHKELQ